MYVRLYGQLKGFQGKKTLSIFSLRYGDTKFIFLILF